LRIDVRIRPDYNTNCKSRNVRKVQMPQDASTAAHLRRTAEDVTTIHQFIISLAEDPNRLAQFRTDPDSVLASAGISPELGDILKAADRYAV
jgi:hypothetical protein